LRHNNPDMWSINIYLRFGLLALSLIVGIILQIQFGFWYAFVFYLAFAFLLTGYFLLGTIQSAALKMQAMDFVGAEQRLALTYFPKLLYPANRAYFYMIKGTIALQNKQSDAAEQWLEKAQSIGLASDNERAMVLLQLANLHASRNKWPMASQMMKQMKELKITEPTIKEQVKQFEKAINNRGLLKPGNRGMIGQVGSKRRRPPAR
jgi:hypothetical protein